MLNQILKDLFFKILKIQAKMVSLSTDENISRTEMHALEAIENGSGLVLTQMADQLGITKATASVTVKRLVKKGFVEKVKQKHDRRMSKLKLTEKGMLTCSKHRQFHEELVASILNQFQIAQYPHVITSLQALLNFFLDLEKELEKV